MSGTGSLEWSKVLVKREIATLTVDGPGQGELSVRNGGPPLQLDSYHIEQIRCPILLIHGGQDGLVSPEEIEKTRQEATAPTSLLFYENGNHSVCNRNLEMSPAMADWLVDQLLA